jgi:hypothetical protein
MTCASIYLNTVDNGIRNLKTIGTLQNVVGVGSVILRFRFIPNKRGDWIKSQRDQAS